MNTVAVAPQPAHVPDAAVYDFDMFLDASLLQNPHERVQELLRDAPPVFWTPRNRGHWVVIGHEELFQAGRDFENFSNTLIPPAQFAALEAMRPPGSPRVPQQKPISLDPLDHSKYRAPLNLAFSPKAMAARIEDIRTLADALIDAVVEVGNCDFMSAVAEPLPVQIFLKMLGLPLERLAEFRRLVHEFLAPGLNNPLEAFRRQRMIADAMTEAILARKAEPQEDLISVLWQTEVAGESMTFDLMEDYCTMLFVAGLDTVINGMGHGIRHLAIDQETQAMLRAKPDLIPNAVEELLRRYTFTIPPRRVAKDVELGGWTLKAGEELVLFLPGADLDPRTFNSPETFNLFRKDKVHIAFGIGPHRCLGSHLARLELKILYSQVLQRLPTFRLDPEKPVTFRGGNIIAVESLPLRWD